MKVTPNTKSSLLSAPSNELEQRPASLPPRIKKSLEIPSKEANRDLSQMEATPLSKTPTLERLSSCAYKALSYLNPLKCCLNSKQTAIDPIEVTKTVMKLKPQKKLNSTSNPPKQVAMMAFSSPTYKSSDSLNSNSQTASLSEDERREAFALNEGKRNEFFKNYPVVQDHLNNWRDKHTEMHQASTRSATLLDKINTRTKPNPKLVGNYIHHSLKKYTALDSLVQKIKELENSDVEPDELEVLNHEIKKLKQLLIIEQKLSLSEQKETNITVSNIPSIYEKNKEKIDKLKISHLTKWEQVCVHFEVEDDESLEIEWKQFQDDVQKSKAHFKQAWEKSYYS